MRITSREKLLDAALKLFAEKGFHATTTEAIAKSAGLSKGLLYNYFDSKEALLEGVVMRAMDEGHEILAELDTIEGTRDKFRFFVNYTFDFYRDRLEYFKLLMALSLQIDQFPEIKTRLMTGKQRGAEVYMEILQELGYAHVQEEMIALASLIRGIGMHYAALPENFPLEAMRNYVLRKYLGEV